MSAEPQTLVEAIRHFADPDVTLKTMVELRWPDGVCCPTCGRSDVRFIATRRMWECKSAHPKKQFSAKIGTIFEDSPLSPGHRVAASRTAAMRAMVSGSAMPSVRVGCQWRWKAAVQPWRRVS